MKNDNNSKFVSSETRTLTKAVGLPKPQISLEKVTNEADEALFGDLKKKLTRMKLHSATTKKKKNILLNDDFSYPDIDLFIA